MNSKILLPGRRQQNDIAQRCRTYNQHHSAEQPIQQDTHCNPFVLVDLGNGQVCSCRIFFELRLTMLGQRHNFCKSFVLVDLGNGQVCNLNKPSYPSLLDICLINKKHILPIYPQKTKLYQQHTPHKISCPIFCCIYRVCTEDKMPPRAYFDVYPMGRLHNFGRTSPPFPKIDQGCTGYMKIPHWHPHC
jgi:hypothetical protein